MMIVSPFLNSSFLLLVLCPSKEVIKFSICGVFLQSIRTLFVIRIYKFWYDRILYRAAEMNTQWVLSYKQCLNKVLRVH